MENFKLMRLLMLTSSLCLPTQAVIAMDSSVHAAEDEDAVGPLMEAVANMAMDDNTEEEPATRKLSPPPGLEHLLTVEAVFNTLAPLSAVSQVPSHRAESSPNDSDCGLCDGCAESTGCKRSPLSEAAQQSPQQLPPVPTHSRVSPLSSQASQVATPIVLGKCIDCENGSGCIAPHCCEVVDKTAGEGANFADWSPVGRDDIRTEEGRTTTDAATSPLRRSPLRNAVVPEAPLQAQLIVAAILAIITANPAYNPAATPESQLVAMIQAKLAEQEETIDIDATAQAIIAEIIPTEHNTVATFTQDEEEAPTNARWETCRRIKVQALDRGSALYDQLPAQGKKFVDLVIANPRLAGAAAAATLASWWATQ